MTEEVKTVTIACGDACGAELTTPVTEVDRIPWLWLPVANKYRCGACQRALQTASSIEGVEQHPFVDNVPKDSRGALPKETASTISPISVRP